MRFALLGDHADGLDLARALAAPGHHQLVHYLGPRPGIVSLQSFGLVPHFATDVEEVLADPDVDAVIIASSPGTRAAQLRRALQSECHVLCVHPAGPTPDGAYEAAMIQADTGRVLLPILPMAYHPGFARLGQWIRAESTPPPGQPDAPSEAIAQEILPPRSHGNQLPPDTSPTARLLEVELWSTEEVLLEVEEMHKSSLPIWDVLRFLGGEIGEIVVYSSGTELAAGQTCLLAGRFVNGGLLQATYLPGQAEARLRVSVPTVSGRASLLFPQGWPGPARLTFTDNSGEVVIAEWPAINPWPQLVTQFENTVERASIKKPQPGRLDDTCLTKPAGQLGWEDEVRALELDDAARRSVERGRAVGLEFQEAVEEAGFKGTMTLIGCSLIWLSVIVLILSAWVPWLGWLIVPVFGLFMFLQALRWIVPKPEPGNEEPSSGKTAR